MARKTVSFRLDAAGLSARGCLEHLRLDEQRQAIVLDGAALYEDDADGCGHPFAKDTLAESVRVRKRLWIDAAGAAAGRVLVYHTVEKLWESPPHDAPVTVRVNGWPFPAVLRQGWNSVAIDPACLRRGMNEIVVCSQDAAKPAIIPIALRDSAVENAPWRASRPPQSHKSGDAGKTWSSDLGEDGRAAGEYMIRLSLDQFLPAGRLVSAVMDLADIEDRQAVKAPVELHSLGCRVEKNCPAGTQAICLIRTGATPVFDRQAWDRWRPVAPGKPRSAAGRYFQLQVQMSTADGTKTPALAGATIKAELTWPQVAGAGTLTVEEFPSPAIVRGCLPFEYEALDHPALRELRQRYRLDEVVAGAASQFERIVRLNHWVSQQWKWHPPVDYPPWDALEILRKLPGGESRGGFCGQFAIAMMQCCLAMGHQARFIFGAWPGVIYGHEVTEVWSDPHGKWVLMDPNMDRHYLDRRSGVPLNAMDLHLALLEFFCAGEALGSPEHNQALLERKDFEEYLRTGPVVVHGGTEAGPDWFDGRRAHLMWGHLSIMPRNDFFSRPRPVPKQHGYGLYWSWNGYRHWFDAQTPRRDWFGGHTGRLADLYWDLNRVCLHLEQTMDPAVLQVTAETCTPSLEALLASVDGGPWRPTAPAFCWRLNPGANILQVKARNRLGVEGPPSTVRLALEVD